MLSSLLIRLGRMGSSDLVIISLLAQLLGGASWIGVSIISQIEFLAFSALSPADRQLFQQFLQRVEVIGLTGNDLLLIERIIAIRQQSGLKLPDAVIAAMASQMRASLVTAAREFAKVKILTLITW